MLGKKSTVIVLVLSILSCHISAVVSQETDLKATYKTFRNLVDTFNKYTRISKRPMTDKEWQELQTTAKRIGVVGVILVSAFVLKKGIQSALNRHNISIKKNIKKKIILNIPLTDKEFANLEPSDQWEHVVSTGNWDRLPQIILEPIDSPLYEIILNARRHDQDIVKGLSIVLNKYPSKINEKVRRRVTPVWQAVYELQSIHSQSAANRLAQAITFLLNQGADIRFQEKLYYGYELRQIGTLQQAIDEAIGDMKARHIDVNAPEIQEMQKTVKEKFTEKK